MLNRTTTNLPIASFSGEYDNGSKSTDFTVDWNNGNKQKVTLTGTLTLTFTAPPGPCALQMKFIQDGTGSRVVTHPTIKTQGGAGIGLPDIIMCYKGYFVGMELKREDGKGHATDVQKKHLEEINNNWGIGVVIDSYEGFLALLADIDATIIPIEDEEEEQLIVV